MSLFHLLFYVDSFFLLFSGHTCRLQVDDVGYSFAFQKIQINTRTCKFSSSPRHPQTPPNTHPFQSHPHPSPPDPSEPLSSRTVREVAQTLPEHSGTSRLPQPEVVRCQKTDRHQAHNVPCHIRYTLLALSLSELLLATSLVPRVPPDCTPRL